MSKKKALYVDMDGTLARFHDVEKRFIEEMWTPGFYVNMKPFANLTAAIALFINRNPDVEVYLLSAVLDTDPPFIEGEKNAWMDKYLPEIDTAHRIFTRAGEDKSQYIDLENHECFLLDDYNKNLYEFEVAGGQGIKFCNDINHRGMGEFGGSKGFLWTGALVHYESSPQQLCRDLAEIVLGRTKTHPMNVIEPVEETVVKDDEGFIVPDEVLDFKRDVEAAADVDEIEYLISRLSDGVAEDIIMIDFCRAVNKEDNLTCVKDAVLTAMDVYLEDNEWYGDSDYGRPGKYYAVMKHPDNPDEEITATGWDVPSIRNWVKVHEEQGYVLVSCDLGLESVIAEAQQSCAPQGERAKRQKEMEMG